MSALKTQDRSRIKYHLGYLATGVAASLQFGVPRPIETLFLVEDAMSNIIDDGFNIQNILRILGILDGIECKLVEAQDYFPAAKTGTIEINEKHLDQLYETYYDWSAKLADVLGVPMYPYARRNQRSVESPNIPVRH